MNHIICFIPVCVQPTKMTNTNSQLWFTKLLINWEVTIKLKIDNDINEENLGLHGLQGNKKLVEHKKQEGVR